MFDLDLEGTVDDQDTRLTAAEENIQGRSLFRHYVLSLVYLPSLTNVQDILIIFAGLQMTDVELDARVTALAETGGGGSSIYGTLLNF